MNTYDQLAQANDTQRKTILFLHERIEELKEALREARDMLEKEGRFRADRSWVAAAMRVMDEAIAKGSGAGV